MFSQIYPLGGWKRTELFYNMNVYTIDSEKNMKNVITLQFDQVGTNWPPAYKGIVLAVQVETL